MKGFIEVTLKSEPTKQYVNLINIESLTRLNGGCLIHFISGTRVTVLETYEEIKELIKNAQ